MWNISDLLFGDDDHERPPRRTRRNGRGKKPSQAGQHQFTVEKPYCSPARPIVMLLEKYGIPIINYKETIKTVPAGDYAKQMGINPQGITRNLPLAQRATFRVPNAQANFAEYLLLRTGKLVIAGGAIDKRNETWAARHDGKMPQPWIEKGCSEGKAIWAPVVKRMKENKRK